MKLKSNHFAPYLPYKLKLIDDSHDESFEFTMDEVSYFGIRSMSEANLLFFFDHPTFPKPILYPMSRIKGKIKHDGGMISPLDILYGDPIFMQAWEEELFIEPRNNPLMASYVTIQKLLEWHFNVFNLPEELYVKKD